MLGTFPALALFPTLPAAAAGLYRDRRLSFASRLRWASTSPTLSTTDGHQPCRPRSMCPFSLRACSSPYVPPSLRHVSLCSPLPGLQQLAMEQVASACYFGSSHQAANPLLVLVVLTSQSQDMQCVENCTDPNPRNHVLYEQPVWQTLQMFRTSRVPSCAVQCFSGPITYSSSLYADAIVRHSRRDALCVVSRTSATYIRAYRPSIVI